MAPTSAPDALAAVPTGSGVGVPVLDAIPAEPVLACQIAKFAATPAGVGPQALPDAQRDATVKSRRAAYTLRHASRGVQVRNRCRTCGVSSHGPVSPALRQDGTAYLAGVTTCASFWCCPTCARTIGQRRALEIRDALVPHLEGGGGLLSGILTAPHGIGDDLGTLWDAMGAALRKIKAHRSYKQLRERLGVLGWIVAREVTYGRSGWHPHLHVLVVTSAPLSEWDADMFSRVVFDLWRAEIERAGLGAPIAALHHFEAVRDVRDLAAYLTKVALEHTRFDTKRAHSAKKRAGQFTPWDLLAEAPTSDRARLLWQEYARVTYRKASLRWDRGLRAALGLGDEATDEELMQEDQIADLSWWVEPLPQDDYGHARRSLGPRLPGWCCDLLEATEARDVSRVNDLLDLFRLAPRLPETYSPPHPPPPTDE